MQSLNAEQMLPTARRHFDGGRLDEAIAAYRGVLAESPGNLVALNNLGAVLRDTGRWDEAMGCFRRAVEVEPGCVVCFSNLLYLMHFGARHDPVGLLAEHLEWARRYAEPLRGGWRGHENSREAGRRLRVGYVSPNFREHPVGRFLMQLYEHHDHEQVEVISYSGVRQADGITEWLKGKSDRWIATVGMSDEALAERVRADGVDVLVDLTMHMRDQRLLVFARKPAPVQVTYLAYCSTTGVRAIDYRLTDGWLDPVGVTD